MPLSQHHESTRAPDDKASAQTTHHLNSAGVPLGVMCRVLSFFCRSTQALPCAGKMLPAPLGSASRGIISRSAAAIAPLTKTLSQPLPSLHQHARTVMSDIQTGSLSPRPVRLVEVEEAMHKIAPLVLADSSFDNVGTLLEAPQARSGKGVLLAIDLTKAVTDEILALPDVSVAIIYHPVIFKPLKTLSFSASAPGATAPNPSIVHDLLRLASAGVSVYCPHTSLDAAADGMNDWLMDTVLGLRLPSDVRPEYQQLGGSTAIIPVPSLAAEAGDCKVLGFGRAVPIVRPALSLKSIIENIRSSANLPHVQLAAAHDMDDAAISSVAVCCGAGSSILNRVKTDVYVTGEMSHHEVLAATASGTSVILLNHSNSERGYLPKLATRLTQLLREDWSVYISTSDKDPLTVV